MAHSDGVATVLAASSKILSNMDAKDRRRGRAACPDQMASWRRRAEDEPVSAATARHMWAWSAKPRLQAIVANGVRLVRISRHADRALNRAARIWPPTFRKDARIDAAKCDWQCRARRECFKGPGAAVGVIKRQRVGILISQWNGPGSPQAARRQRFALVRSRAAFAPGSAMRVD